MPWYVTGRLDAADTARVEIFLAAHPEMRRQLALVREEQEQSILASEAAGLPSRGALNRLMAAIARESQPRAQVRGAWDRIAEFFAAPTPGGVRWAAAAAALLLLVQAAVIGSLLIDRRSDPYQTASGKQAPAGGSTLLVGFTDGATASAIAALLSEFDAQIVEGPKPGGMYRIRLTKAPATRPSGRKSCAVCLRGSDVVKMVLLGTD